MIELWRYARAERARMARLWVIIATFLATAGAVIATVIVSATGG